MNELKENIVTETLDIIKNEGDESLSKIHALNQNLLNRIFSLITLSLGISGFIAISMGILSEKYIGTNMTTINPLIINIFYFTTTVSILFLLLCIIIGLALFSQPGKIISGIGPNLSDLYGQYKTKSKEITIKKLIEGNILAIEIGKYLNLKIARYIFTMILLMIYAIIFYSVGCYFMLLHDKIYDDLFLLVFLTFIGITFVITIVKIWSDVNEKMCKINNEILKLNKEYIHMPESDINVLLGVSPCKKKIRN